VKLFLYFFLEVFQKSLEFNFPDWDIVWNLSNICLHHDHIQIHFRSQGKYSYVVLPLCHKVHIFGPKREQVTGEYKELHNYEFHNLYIPLYVMSRIRSRKM